MTKIPFYQFCYCGVNKQKKRKLQLFIHLSLLLFFCVVSIGLNIYILGSIKDYPALLRELLGGNNIYLPYDKYEKLHETCVIYKNIVETESTYNFTNSSDAFIKKLEQKYQECCQKLQEQNDIKYDGIKSIGNVYSSEYEYLHQCSKFAISFFLIPALGLYKLSLTKEGTDEEIMLKLLVIITCIIFIIFICVSFKYFAIGYVMFNALDLLEKYILKC